VNPAAARGTVKATIPVTPGERLAVCRGEWLANCGRVQRGAAMAGSTTERRWADDGGEAGASDCGQGGDRLANRVVVCRWRRRRRRSQCFLRHRRRPGLGGGSPRRRRRRRLLPRWSRWLRRRRRLPEIGGTGGAGGNRLTIKSTRFDYQNGNAGLNGKARAGGSGEHADLTTSGRGGAESGGRPRAAATTAARWRCRLAEQRAARRRWRRGPVVPRHIEKSART